MSDERPEPDRVDGAPHPRATENLYGHDAAQQAFVEAHGDGKLHHAWLITGPRGIGKATLAWRMARFLAADTGTEAGLFGDTLPASASLQMDPNEPVFRQTVQLSHPGIALCRRAWDDKAKRLRTELTVDEIRKLKSHFSMSAAEGGWRVAIIDSADEMNRSAANAILKLLEEPPARTVLILISHSPARLLPTIRSRCRMLRLSPLTNEDMVQALGDAAIEPDGDPALFALANGSVGTAIELITGEGLHIYRNILTLLGQAPRMDRGAIIALGDRCTGRNAAPLFEMVLRLTVLAISRLVRAGVTGPKALLPEESTFAARLCNDVHAARAWSKNLQQVQARSAHARAVNLDPGQVILDMFLQIEQTAGQLSLLRS